MEPSPKREISSVTTLGFTALLMNGSNAEGVDVNTARRNWTMTFGSPSTSSCSPGLGVATASLGQRPEGYAQGLEGQGPGHYLLAVNSADFHPTISGQVEPARPLFDKRLWFYIYHSDKTGFYHSQTMSVPYLTCFLKENPILVSDFLVKTTMWEG